MTLMGRPARPPTGAFTPVAGPVATDAGGQLLFSVLPGANTVYHAMAATQRNTASADIAVGLVFNVKLKASDRTPSSGKAVKFSGTVFPLRRRHARLDPKAQPHERRVRDRGRERG